MLLIYTKEKIKSSLFISQIRLKLQSNKNCLKPLDALLSVLSELQIILRSLLMLCSSSFISLIEDILEFIKPDRH